MDDDLASDAGNDKLPLPDLDDGGSGELDDSDLNEDVARLRAAWRNEVSAPELLTIDESLVSDLIQQVENQQEIVDDARASPEDAFSASLYQMELDRLRYSLSKYLRTRLRKVERDALHVLASGDGGMEGRLSDREREHTKGYVDMLEDHFTRTCLSQSAAKAKGSSLLALPETLDPAQEEQLRQQREMQKLEARIRDAAAREAMPGGGGPKVEGEAERRMRELYEERLREYGELAAVDEKKEEEERDTVEDAEATGGVIDGGTWEHRKRAKEMLKTAETALSLTLQAKGAHHMGQYLPKEELDHFLKKSTKAAKGEAAELEEDFEKNKLAEDNIGFQMLKKAGWTEGEGLGKEGEGTAAPVNMAAGADGAGVGVKETHEVAEGDNEFEQYRKRMMLAYRFRPNPMNNPRRSYY